MFIFVDDPASAMKADKPAAPLTPEDAYVMGYRHISDLALMNQIAELIRGDDPDGAALRLLEAWREGAFAAQAMIERPGATLQ